MAPSCKLKLARFSDQLRIQDGARVWQNAGRIFYTTGKNIESALNLSALDLGCLPFVVNLSISGNLTNRMDQGGGTDLPPRVKVPYLMLHLIVEEILQHISQVAGFK